MYFSLLLTLQNTVIPVCTTRFDIKICLRGAFVFRVIRRTVITFPNSINWLVLVMKMQYLLWDSGNSQMSFTWTPIQI
jgi:hypothetical protein